MSANRDVSLTSSFRVPALERAVEGFLRSVEAVAATGTSSSEIVTNRDPPIPARTFSGLRAPGEGDLRPRLSQSFPDCAAEPSTAAGDE